MGEKSKVLLMTALLRLPVVFTMKFNFLCHYLGKDVKCVKKKQKKNICGKIHLILLLAFDNPIGSVSQSKIWIITISQVVDLIRYF